MNHRADTECNCFRNYVRTLNDIILNSISILFRKHSYVIPVNKCYVAVPTMTNRSLEDTNIFEQCTVREKSSPWTNSEK